LPLNSLEIHGILFVDCVEFDEFIAHLVDSIAYLVECIVDKVGLPPLQVRRSIRDEPLSIHKQLRVRKSVGPSAWHGLNGDGLVGERHLFGDARLPLVVDAGVGAQHDRYCPG
jgi:hypothetical protein